MAYHDGIEAPALGLDVCRFSHHLLFNQIEKDAYLNS